MKKAFFIAVLVILGISFLFPQASGRGKIKGTVREEGTNKPLEGVTIKLTHVKSGASYNQSVKTDSTGFFKALFLRSGVWNIDFEKPGYETKKMSYKVDETPGVAQPDMEITLKKIEGIVISDNLISELEKGDKLFMQGKYSEALVKYQEIIKNNPEAFILHKNVGNCYFAMEQYDKAIESYLKILEKQPDSFETMVLIGNSFNNQKNIEKAFEWYSKVPIEAIKNIDTLYNMGVIMYNSNKMEEAVKYFQKAIEIDADFADGYYQLGMCYAALNKVDEAIAALKKFMELDPESPNYSVAKAIIEAFQKVK